MPHVYTLLGVSDPFDPLNRYTTSIILPLPVLALVRLLISLYAFVTIFFTFGWDCTHGQTREARRWFSYFTNLTYSGLAFYFLFSGLHTLSYTVRGKSWLNSWPRPLQAAHAIYYTTIVTFPPLVTIVYWAVLYENPWFEVEVQAWSNVSKHGLNSLFALLEILLPRTKPPPPLHLAFLIFILALYLSLAYLSQAVQGFYPYSFLDPSEGGSGKVAAYCFGILAAICVIFGVVWCIIWFRCWVAGRLGLDHDRGAIKKRQRTLGDSTVDQDVEELKG
ncbi:MAG: hypothetical protein Q9163_006043 [Psora crenata]